MEVTLIDSMGDDITVVNAARVSFAKESEWEYGPYCEQCNDHHGPYLPEKDEKLIQYLAKNGHWTPFAHVQITLREKVPIFVARQRFKHTVGFVYNEVSRRYVDDPPEFFAPDVWRKRAEDKKQGSSDEEIVYLGDPDVYLNDKYRSAKYKHEIWIKSAASLYEEMVASGVAPEQARMVLPQSMYTEYYCTGSLAAFARAYKLRSDTHAQKEIQDLAAMWDNTISSIQGLETSWKALTQ